MSQPRVGRPRKSAAERATAYVPIHMTEADRELCQEAADAEGMSLAGWGRKHLVRRASSTLKRKG